MPSNDREKLNRVEELKSKLESRNYEAKREHLDSFTHSKEKEIPDAWADGRKVGADFLNPSNRFFMKTSMFKKFFKFSIAFFILTLMYASYVFFFVSNTVSNDNIDISVLGNNFTAGGEELSLVVGITNKNNTALDLVDLIVAYSKNSSDAETDLPSGTERTRVSLGTIPAGAVRNENVKVVLFGQQGSIRTIKISIEYRVEGSNAIFVKEKPYEVTINSSPINLSVEAPTTVSPNQDIRLDVKATLNATRPTSKILLRLDYPSGFQFLKSTPPPSLGNNVWELGDIPPGADRTISITGKMLDVFDGEEKIFHIRSGSQSTSDKSMIDVVFNSLAHSILVKKPFIEANLFINGVAEREFAVDTKTPIRGEIRWANNLETRINDLEIHAKITGNAVNRQTIDAEQGFYNSGKDEIVWDKNSLNRLREVNPGDSGSVSFSVSPFPLYSASGGMLTNPSISVEINVSGKQSLEGYSTEELNNFASSTIRIISDVGLTAKALHFSGPFTNTGPIPPKVETPTSYTIVWFLSNTANNISRGVVRATLPSWVSFVGPISPAGEDVDYNASTREVVWTVGTIPKGTGITAAGRTASFQVILTPSLSQLRTTPVIINESVLTGHDDFANVDVRGSRPSQNTMLADDPGFPPSGATVVE